MAMLWKAPDVSSHVKTSPPNEVTDVFAFGMLNHCVMVGIEPYPSMPDAEVEECYRKQKFPNTDNIICGKIIFRCWIGECAAAKEMFRDLISLKEQS